MDKIRPNRTLWAAGALGAGLIVAVPSQASGPEPLSPESWLTVDDNSPEATRLALDGTVTVQLAVSADGRVTGCSLVKSSGHDILDEHTCKVLSSRARFKPATDAAGRPVPGTFNHSMTWQVITNANWAQDGVVQAETTIDPATGAATGCTADIRGAMSDHMRQMACFVLVNQTKALLATLPSRPIAPMRARLLISVRPENQPPGQEPSEDAWRRVSYTKASVRVSPRGLRTDCQMVETRGASNLLFPICDPTPQFRYVPSEDARGNAVPTSLSQEVVYFVEAGSPESSSEAS